MQVWQLQEPFCNDFQPFCNNISCCANVCPNKEKEEQSSHVKITLFTHDIHKCYIEKFVGETLNYVVLDCGCTKNVCGNAWLDSYLKTLAEKDAQKVVEESSTSSFKFGDGNSKAANKSVTIPARMGNEGIMIKTDVIDCGLPFLLRSNEKW